MAVTRLVIDVAPCEYSQGRRHTTGACEKVDEAKTAYSAAFGALSLPAPEFLRELTPKILEHFVLRNAFLFIFILLS
jgi:hypothetical protein